MEQDFPSLQDLAAEVAYKEVLSNLILCHGHRPQGKQLNWLPYSSLLRLMDTSGLLQSEQVCDFVRKRLNLGILGCKIRKDFVKKFYESVRKSGVMEDFGLVEPWVFLDCVLDSNFEELETHVAYPGSGPSPKLIPTIVKRCPLLKTLFLNFRLIKSETEFEELKAVIQSLELLKNLTDLELVLPKLDDNQQATLLNIVGKSCPLLSRLAVSSQNLFKDEDILAVFIGNLMAIDEAEPPQHSDSLARLELPVTSLNPVCFTLKKFEVVSIADVSRDAAAFVLGHAPLLEDLFICNSSTGDAVQLLYELEQQDLAKSTHGKLALTTLGFVDVSDATLLRAVGALCPHLKTVIFSKEDEREVSPTELQSLFNEWPKLTSIKLFGLQSSQNVRSILKAFGPELIDLEFAWRCEFNMRDLHFCTKLESLQIGQDTLLLDLDQMDISATFLPELKVLSSPKICLGSWSSLFETKSSLVSISLACCHIGCKSSSSSESQWNRIPQMWPRLEFMDIKDSTGLTAALLVSIIDRMPKLREIVIPYRPNEIGFSQAVERIRSRRQPPIKLHLHEFEDRNSSCTYMGKYH